MNCDFIRDGDVCYIKTDKGLIRTEYIPEIKTLFLSNLIVDEVFRNHGMGTHLMNSALNYAKLLECTTVSLQVNINNLILKNWYEKLGFNFVGYGYEPDLYLMSKIICKE